MYDTCMIHIYIYNYYRSWESIGNIDEHPSVFFFRISQVGGVGGVGRVQVGVHLRLLQRASPAPGTGAVASGTAAVGVGGGDVAQEARGVDGSCDRISVKKTRFFLGDGIFCNFWV